MENYRKYFYYIFIIFCFLFIPSFNVNAEEFSNLNYLNWSLTTNNNAILNSGNTPFYTSYLARDFEDARLYLYYTNYIAYSEYFYDITFEYYFDNLSSNNDFLFSNSVVSCNIYVEGSNSQFSDGCEIVEKDERHIKFRTRNLRTFQPGSFVFQLNSETSHLSSNNYLIHVQLNSFKMNIIAKIDTSVSGDQFQQGVNDIINSNNQNSQNIINQIKAGDDALINKQNETNSKIQETNDTLKNNDSSEATNEAGSFFSGFETDTFGLTSIITAPLNLIESVTSSTCVPMGLPIPFVEGQTLNLPCLRGIYENHFGTFYDIYKTITFGIVAYWVCVRLFNLVKDFKNPEHDEIEVLEL